MNRDREEAEEVSNMLASPANVRYLAAASRARWCSSESSYRVGTKAKHCFNALYCLLTGSPGRSSARSADAELVPPEQRHYSNSGFRLAAAALLLTVRRR